MHADRSWTRLSLSSDSRLACHVVEVGTGVCHPDITCISWSGFGVLPVARSDTLLSTQQREAARA